MFHFPTEFFHNWFGVEPSGYELVRSAWQGVRQTFMQIDMTKLTL